ncbi:MAG TPA: calcium-binding protein [Thermoleophilaceae bacterium]|nr:calcium-binding protein [Thermoleophilaceae bacterium]
MLFVAAVAFANGDGNDRVHARGGDDVVDAGGGNDRVRGGKGDDTLFGGGGDDRLKGGQDEDYLDGGEGDDRINGRGDGRDGDEIVCGPGEDTVLLGRNDVVVGSAKGSMHPDEEEADDDSCEHVKYPKGKHPVEKPCAARSTTYCDDPGVVNPEPDEPIEEPAPDEPGEY